MKEFQLCRNLTGEVLSTVIPRSYIDHLKEGTMNSGTVKDVRTIDLTDDDDDDDTSGDQNGNMEWMNETIFHFQQWAWVDINNINILCKYCVNIV